MPIICSRAKVTKRGVLFNCQAPFYTHGAPEVEAVASAHSTRITCSGSQAVAFHMFPQRQRCGCDGRLQSRKLGGWTTTPAVMGSRLSDAVEVTPKRFAAHMRDSRSDARARAKCQSGP